MRKFSILYYRYFLYSLLLLVPTLAITMNNESMELTNSVDLQQETSGQVWIASIISILIISSVGLFGVAVVPLIQKVFFNQLIQFLVGVAVGTLTGDAFMHLIPHSFMNHSHEKGSISTQFLNDEKKNVLRGATALTGIYFFFLAEKILSIISEDRTEKKVKEEEKDRFDENAKLPIDTDSAYTKESNQIIDQILKVNSPINILSATDDSVSPLRRPSRQAISQKEPYCRRASRAIIIEDNILTVGLTNRAMKNIESLYRYKDNEQRSDNFDEGGMTEQINYDQKEKNNKKHNQLHGHSHEIPASVAAVAYMVIMGDGLHNFTDGMAIGVAFTTSIAGGISTTVAVFCHELPHELGDFAVLLKTGMQLRQAIFFNVISSILSVFGMFSGIILGKLNNANSWISMFTSGTFIYISLVDMLPQLSTSEVKEGESRLLQFVIQNFGLLTGMGLMLLIALFEDSIKILFMEKIE